MSVAIEQARLITPVTKHVAQIKTYKIHNGVLVAKGGPNISANTDAIEALDLTMEAPSTNCYIADAHRESMSPQQFTATYDRARDFIREAGRSSIDIGASEKETC